MKIVILTSAARGSAPACLRALCASPPLGVAAVVLARRNSPHRARRLLRTLKKTAKIGPLGALNGLRLRRWYQGEAGESVLEVARELSVPVIATDSIHSGETRRALAGAELGLSLGNGYIPRSVYSIPRHGMINVHEELLPEFRGAQSVIWPIYEGRTQTGFTIHQIDERIDAGPILYQERFDIEFGPTLRETVLRNRRRIAQRVPAALALVCGSYTSLRERAEPQREGKTYTTPTIWEFLRMVRVHRRIRIQAIP